MPINLFATADFWNDVLTLFLVAVVIGTIAGAAFYQSTERFHDAEK